MKPKVYAVTAVLLVAAATLGADTFRIGLSGGLNNQSYDFGQPSIRPGSGFGLHGGLGGEFFLTPGCLPAQLGLELGIIRQNARYNWSSTLPNLCNGLVYNNLVIPLLAKARIGIIPKTDLQVGLGLSLIRNLSGYWRMTGSGGEIDIKLADKDLHTDLGFQIKGDVGFKIAPIIYIVPFLTYQINMTADDPNTPNYAEKEHALFLGVGISFGL